MRALVESAARADASARLELLVQAWQAERQPELAVAVAECARALGPSVDLGPDPNDLEAWHRRAAAQPSAHERGDLLLRINTTKWQPALAQLEVVATWPADPRTVDTLLALIDRAPYRSHPALALWQRIYELLVALADPRALAALPAAETYARQFARAETKRSIARRLTELRSRLAALPEHAPLGPEDAALLDQLRPRREAPTTEADLLAQIYANPRDDGLRAVYADLLATRGDPRGELINLQLLTKPGKPQRDRIKQLLREHQQAWLGPLADVALVSDLRYARGFPAAISLDGAAAGPVIERLTGHPAWRTLTALDVRGDRPGYADFLADEAFFGLEELTTVSATALLRFVEPAPRALTRMLVSGDFESYLLPAQLRAAILSGVGLPQLRTLGLRYSTGAAADGLLGVLVSPLGQALTRLELELPGYDQDLPRCLAALLGVEAPNLAEVACAAAFNYDLTRGADGWTMRATYKGGSQTDRFPTLVALLDALRERGMLERVIKLELATPRYTPDPRELVRLRRAARDLELVGAHASGRVPDS